MAFLKKSTNGSYYVCHSNNGGPNPEKRLDNKDWFVGRAISKNSQHVNIKSIKIPKELLGKKLRFRVEIKKEKEKKCEDKKNGKHTDDI